MRDLFDGSGNAESFAPGAFLLRGYVRDHAPGLYAAVQALWAAAPMRRMHTPYGPMSVDMTSWGPLGWVSDAAGYRYSPVDPVSGHAWPEMPALVRNLAHEAAALCGYVDFVPDSCLVNCYLPGARMGLHQDRDEPDPAHPIVSLSLGLSAVFLFGGARRTDPVQKIPLHHGDVVVWGGLSRRYFHGIQPIKAGTDPLCGGCRINLTCRRAGADAARPS